MRVISVLDSTEIPIGYTGLVEFVDGSKRWYVDGKLHRLDGPARVWSDGAQWWYMNDRVHRVGGPAIEHRDGTRYWLNLGELHRLDGPAVEYAAGSKEWWVDGVNVTEDKYLEAVLLYRCKAVLDS